MFSVYLKSQLIDFVDCYKKYFWRTFGVALTLTVLSFAVIAILLKYSDFDDTRSKGQISLLSYFFVRYSEKDVYSLVDLSKTIFIFFVALFSVGLYRLTDKANEVKHELSFIAFVKKIKIQDVLLLIICLFFCAAIDYGLFEVKSFVETDITKHELKKWLNALLFMARIYVPLILFSILLFKLLNEETMKLDFKKVLFLLVSLWLFNEFSFEISLVIRSHVFGLILILTNEEKKYLFESLLGMPLIAFYFMGYYAAMTGLIRLNNKED